MGRFIDLTGQRFGILTVISKSQSVNGMTRWLCKCECGQEKDFYSVNLKRGLSESCGCIRTQLSRERRLIHGHTAQYTRSKEHIAWVNMVQRCTNPKNTEYENYGGRGITICEQWINDFEIFLSDMGAKPTRNHSIERIDVNGNYEPSNCKWATNIEQARNKRPHKNKSGYTGVYYQQRKNIWQASIRISGKNISLGYFTDPEKAADARKQAEIKYWIESS